MTEFLLTSALLLMAIFGGRFAQHRLRRGDDTVEVHVVVGVLGLLCFPVVGLLIGTYSAQELSALNSPPRPVVAVQRQTAAYTLHTETGAAVCSCSCWTGGTR